MSDVTRTHGPPEPDTTRTAHDSPAGAAPPDPTSTLAASEQQSREEAARSAQAPVVVAGYAIEGELGRGGVGVVYRARQLSLNRTVALKMLHRLEAAGPQALIRFLAEAEAIASVRHPHVVQVYEFGQHDGLPFIALEYLSGGTLADRLKTTGRMDSRDAARLVARLALAVQAAHDAGIVHRDLKPGNVLFDETGQPKVADFGLAKRVQSDLTRTQAVMGTPAYMSPEQAKGETKFVGPGSDVYSLGAILYECLTGTRPFDADDPWVVIQRVITADPESPRRRAPDVPRDLELICLKCLAKRPADRYPTAAALLDELEDFLAGRPVSVRPAGTGERMVRWARRNPVVAGLLTALAAVFLLGFAGVTWGLLRAEARGKDLERANDDLTNSRDALAALTGDLTRSRDDLVRAEGEAKRRAAEAEYRGYLSDVALAHQLWKANDLRGMRAALDRCPTGRRGWEWHYLDRLSRPVKAEVPVDGIPLDVRYSPDGSLLAVICYGGGVVVRDRATDTDRFRIPPGKAGDEGDAALAFHPNGRELAVLHGRKVVMIDLTATKPPPPRDLNIPREFINLSSSEIRVAAIAYTGEGQLLAAVVGGSRDLNAPGKPQPRTFVIRDVKADKTVAKFVGYEEPGGVALSLGGAAFSPDGTRLAFSVVDSGNRYSGGSGTKTPEEMKKTNSAIEEAAAAFRPFTAVFDVASGKLLRQVTTSGPRYRTVAFAADGKRVAVGDGRRLVLFDPDSTAPPAVHEIATGDRIAVAFGPGGRVWSGGDDRMVVGLDPTGAEPDVTLPGSPGMVFRVAVAPDGKEVAVASADLVGLRGGVLRFDPAAGVADVWRSPAGGERVSLVVAFSPGANRFAAFDSVPRGDGAFRFVLRDLATGAEKKTAKPGAWVNGVFLADGGMVVTDGEEVVRLGPDAIPGRKISLWGKSSHVGQFGPPAIACTPDGKKVVGAVGLRARVEKDPKKSAPARLRLFTWDEATGGPGKDASADLSALQPADPLAADVMVMGCAVDPAGSRAAAVGVVRWRNSEGRSAATRWVVVAWDLATGAEVFRKVSEEQFRCVAFDPLGRLVVGGGSDVVGMVSGWDLTSGQEVLALRGHTRQVLAVAFGPGGRVATGGADRVVKVWDPATGREVLTLDGFEREVTQLAFTPDGKALAAGTGFDMFGMMAAGGPAQLRWPQAQVRLFRGPP